jgi:hypothetical protein
MIIASTQIHSPLDASKGEGRPEKVLPQYLASGFERYETVIVKHRYDTIEFTCKSPHECRIRRQRPLNENPPGLRFADCGNDMIGLLCSEQSAFAGMWIKTANRYLFNDYG